MASWFNIYKHIEPFVHSERLVSTSDLWKVSFSPYETTSWQSLVFVMPFYFLMYLIPKERSFSTCYSYLYFNFVSKRSISTHHSPIHRLPFAGAHSLDSLGTHHPNENSAGQWLSIRCPLLDRSFQQHALQWGCAVRVSASHFWPLHNWYYSLIWFTLA